MEEAVVGRVETTIELDSALLVGRERSICAKIYEEEFSVK